MRSVAARWTSSRPIATVKRPRSRASARPSATRSRSSPRPAGWASTTACARRSRRASSSCCESRGSARGACARSHAELGIETMEDLRKAAEAGELRSLRGLSAKTEQLILEGIDRLEVRAEAAAPPPRRDAPGAHGGADRHPRRPVDRAGGLVPASAREHRRPRPARRDRRRPGPDRDASRRWASSITS